MYETILSRFTTQNITKLAQWNSRRTFQNRTRFSETCRARKLECVRKYISEQCSCTKLIPSSPGQSFSSLASGKQWSDGSCHNQAWVHAGQGSRERKETSSSISWVLVWAAAGPDKRFFEAIKSGKQGSLHDPLYAVHPHVAYNLPPLAKSLLFRSLRNTRQAGDPSSGRKPCKGASLCWRLCLRWGKAWPMSGAALSSSRPLQPPGRARVSIGPRLVNHVQPLVTYLPLFAELLAPVGKEWSARQNSPPRGPAVLGAGLN